MTDNSIETVLVDFDGVISKSAVNMIIHFMRDFIYPYYPIDIKTVQEYVKIANCFYLEDSIELLFSSLGLKDKINAFALKLKDLREHKGLTAEIAGDFYAFAQFCCERHIDYKVFSLSDVKKITGLLSEYFEYKGGSRYFSLNNVLAYKNASKANALTYRRIKDEFGIETDSCLIIDDNPLTLAAAKQEGLATGMMLNDIFTDDDYAAYKSQIDFKFGSFTDVMSKIDRYTAGKRGVDAYGVKVV